LDSEVIGKSSEVLFLRLVIEREDEEIRGDEENEEKEFWIQHIPQVLEAHLQCIEREIMGNQEKGKKVDEVSGCDEVGYIEQRAKQVKPSDGNQKDGQKRDGILLIL